MKRRENNAGSVTKLQGNRRNPYVARLPRQVSFDGEKAIEKREILGYFPTQSSAWDSLKHYREIHPEMFDGQKNRITFSRNVTLQSLWNKFIQSREFTSISKSTQGNYSAVWNKYVSVAKDRSVRDIRTSDIQAIIDGIQAKSGTKKNALTVMRKLLDMAIADDVISRNYADYVSFDSDESEICRKTFCKADIDTLMNYKGEYKPLCDLLLISAFSGARLKEICELKADNIKMDAEVSTFEIVQGKNKFAMRSVPIHNALYDIFVRLLINCAKNTENRLFGVNMSQIYHSAETISKILGQEHYPYDAKHSFITQAHLCNVDDLALKNIIGHTPKTTSEKYYTHIPMDRLKAEIEKVHY